MSHTTEFVEFTKHTGWYADSLVLESRILLICETDSGEKIALVHFDVSRSDAIISINLNPNQRGKGLAKSCLLKSIEFISKSSTEINRLIAEIKEENIASQKTFLGVGFKKYNIEDNIGFYEKILD